MKIILTVCSEKYLKRFLRAKMSKKKIEIKNDIKIIFAAKDYPKQFERLEYIMRYYAKENKRQEIKQIDLSLKERADVKPKDSKNDRK